MHFLRVCLVQAIDVKRPDQRGVLVSECPHRGVLCIAASVATIKAIELSISYKK